MANTEIYKPINALAVPGHSLKDVQGTPILTNGVPLKEGHIPAFSLVSVNGEFQDNPTVLKDRLIRVSPIHGRSYELPIDNTRNVFWADEYGNVFSVLTTKGNNLENPTLLTQYPTPSGYAVYGLQDSESMVRILRASEILRANNVDTEAIVKVIEPTELPFGDKLIPLEDVKAQLLIKTWEQSDANEEAPSKEDVASISLALDNMTFFITVRALQVAERLQDLTQSEKNEDFEQMMNRVFIYVNQYEQLRRKKDASYEPKQFKANNGQDITEYFGDYLPRKLGANFGKMHKLKLVHFFPHPGNISASGGIYDLDSIRGEVLDCGDEKVTEANIGDDIVKLMNGVDHRSDGLLFTLENLQKKGFVDKDPMIKFRLMSAFFKEYINQRGWADDPMGNIKEVYTHFWALPGKTFGAVFLAEYVMMLYNQLGFRYHLPEDLSKIKSAFEESKRRDAKARFDKIKGKQETVDQDLLDEDGIHAGSDPVKLNRIDLLFNAIEQDVRSQLEHHFKMLSTQYDSDILDTAIAMFTEEAENSIDAILRNDEMDMTQHNEYYRQLIAAEGWEDDIVVHAGQIHDIFENFAKGPKDKPYLDYYLGLLTQQIGLDFQFESQDAYSILDKYFKKSEKEFDQLIRKIVREASPDASLEEVIATEYKKAGYSQGADFPWDDWEMFNNENSDGLLWIIERRILPQLKEKLISDYGEDVYGGAFLLCQDRAEQVIAEVLTDQEIQAQKMGFDFMELKIMRKYTDHPELAYNQEELEKIDKSES